MCRPPLVVLLHHFHITEHYKLACGCIEKVGKDSADYEKQTCVDELHGFDPILADGPRIESSVYAVGRIVDERRDTASDQLGSVDIFGLSPVIINDNIVKTGYDEIYGSPYLDCGHVGCQMMLVACAIVRDRKSVVRRWAGLPGSERHSRIGQRSGNRFVIIMIVFLRSQRQCNRSARL